MLGTEPPIFSKCGRCFVGTPIFNDFLPAGGGQNLGTVSETFSDPTLPVEPNAGSAIANVATIFIFFRFLQPGCILNWTSRTVTLWAIVLSPTPALGSLMVSRKARSTRSGEPLTKREQNQPRLRKWQLRRNKWELLALLCRLPPREGMYLLNDFIER